VQAQRSLIAEVEQAVASQSSKKRVETLRRVTDLFMIGADSYSDSQVGVFDDVISRLADRIEMAARAELARRLAPVENAPIRVVRTLARDEAIEVAGPVLSQSPRLTDEDLLECASGRSQERLLAISKRVSISEAVSDVLVTHGGEDVVRSVVSNEGARFSSASYGRLVNKSLDDEELALSVGLRKDIPKEHFHALVSKASEAVYRKLAAANPAAVGVVNRVLFELTGRTADAKLKAGRDYTEAKAAFDSLQQSGQSIDTVVHDFAKSGKFEETVVALSELCGLPIDAVERIMSDSRADSDLALILAKAAGLTWSTAKMILQLRRGESGLPPQTAETARVHFDRLQAATARRVVRFFQVRHAAGDRAD
jgi:uncharacterized protein (DUF2336 family)